MNRDSRINARICIIKDLSKLLPQVILLESESGTWKQSIEIEINYLCCRFGKTKTHYSTNCIFNLPEKDVNLGETTKDTPKDEISSEAANEDQVNKPHEKSAARNLYWDLITPLSQKTKMVSPWILTSH
ncbi:hypothetical protein SUGI_0072280 [Cryptomeria japonica]|nr:hypothetical protein SUGI_0072280 [Cryptomeria japonica]